MVLIRVPARTTGGGAGGVARGWYFACFSTGQNNGGSWFNQIGKGSDTAFTVTEADAQITINRTITVNRTTAQVTANTKASNQTIAFRDDGVNVGALVILANTTGIFDSGAISVVIASGSLCNFGYLWTVGGVHNVACFLCEWET